jgi:hypothetical protein
MEVQWDSSGHGSPLDILFSLAFSSPKTHSG